MTPPRRASRKPSVCVAAAPLEPTTSSVPPTSDVIAPGPTSSSENAVAPSGSSTSTIRTCDEPAAARQHGQRDLAAGPGLDVGGVVHPRSGQRRDGADGEAAQQAAPARRSKPPSGTARSPGRRRGAGRQARPRGPARSPRPRAGIHRLPERRRGRRGRRRTRRAPPRRRRSRTRRSAPWWSSRSTPTPPPPGGVRRRSWRPPSSGALGQARLARCARPGELPARTGRGGRGRLLRRRPGTAQGLQPPGHRVALGRNGVGRRGRRTGLRGHGARLRWRRTGLHGRRSAGALVAERHHARAGILARRRTRAAARLATSQLLEALSRTLDPFPRHGAFIPPVPPAPAGAGRSR